MSLNYKNPLIILAFVFFTYAPILFNQYIGDDHIIIEKNTFYSSWKNLPRLFKKGYITDLRAINYNNDTRADFGPGSVSYRPVSNFSYFLDYSLFHARPFGSHLINIFIHAVNTLLVYWIVDFLFFSSALGLFAALFFSLHPLQSEPVAVMSYRADIISAFFVLVAFIFWIKFQKGRFLNHGYYMGALFMYGAAVFSKESSIMLPFVIFSFDQLFGTLSIGLKQRSKYYLGFVVILFFYLYLYFFVFPNSSLQFHWLGGSFLNHGLTMGYIWYTYLINCLFPWTVKLVPGLYCPPPPMLLSLKTVEIGILLVVFIAAAKFLWLHHKNALFFLFWYALFYLPISNIVPIANPIASRFMYLPSIGSLVVGAWFLHEVSCNEWLKRCSQRLPIMLHVAIIFILMVCTLFLNVNWRSDFDVAYSWVKDYPESYRGYGLLGKLFFYRGHFKRAKEYLEKSIQMGDQLPNDVFILAQCYRVLGEFQEAQFLLKQIIAHNPGYADPYFELAAVYYFQHNTFLEQEMLKKGLALDPRKSAMYIPLMR